MSTVSPSYVPPKDGPEFEELISNHMRLIGQYEARKRRIEKVMGGGASEDAEWQMDRVHQLDWAAELYPGAVEQFGVIISDLLYSRAIKIVWTKDRE